MIQYSEFIENMEENCKDVELFNSNFNELKSKLIKYSLHHDLVFDRFEEILDEYKEDIVKLQDVLKCYAAYIKKTNDIHILYSLTIGGNEPELEKELKKLEYEVNEIVTKYGI